MERDSQQRKARADELLNGRQLIYCLSEGQANNGSRQVFREFVELAAEFGATHVEVGRLPFRYGTQFLPDNHDPYAAWCNTSLGLLWTFPSGELTEWISSDEAQRRQEILASQVAELQRFGLKGVVDSVEPMWLPEAVYRAHPRWRGAQCELGRIARRPYFAPCIDEPEVLELYREATHALCKQFPEIDQLKFLSNDSGAGIDWTPNTYPGMNGHNRWRGRDAGQRIAVWLQALQEGAARAGTQIRVHLHSSGLPIELKNSGRTQLGPHQFIGFAGKNDELWTVADATLGSGLRSLSYPAAGLGDAADFVSGLQNIFSNPQSDSHRATINLDESNLSTARLLLEEFLNEPGQGSVHRSRVLLSAAERICGNEGAETFVAAWKNVQGALHATAQVRQKGFGHVLPFCIVSMRWLLRPLVPRPEVLSKEETEYFRKFLFSVVDNAEQHNLCNVLGKPVFRGEGVMWMARWCLQEAIGTLRSEQQKLKTLARQLEGDAAASVDLYAARVGALACLAHTAQNVIRYQYALDIAHHPQYGWNVMDYDENILYDQRGLQLRKIAREELDNIEDLMEIIQSQNESVIIHAQSPEEESVFRLGPNLITDLQRKREIMLDHWHDYEILFPATKVWEFEPHPPQSDTPI